MRNPIVPTALIGLLFASGAGAAEFDINGIKLGMNAVGLSPDIKSSVPTDSTASPNGNFPRARNGSRTAGRFTTISLIQMTWNTSG